MAAKHILCNECWKIVKQLYVSVFEDEDGVVHLYDHGDKRKDNLKSTDKKSSR